MRRAKIWVALVIILGGLGLALRPAIAAADEGAEDCPEGQVHTTIIGGGGCVDVSDGEGVYMILRLVATILVYGLGAAATIGVIVAGVMYLTAKDSPDKVAKARTRLIEVAIGLVAWAVLAVVLNWLIPGGVSLNPNDWGKVGSVERSVSMEVTRSAVDEVIASN